jgi:phosphohistidine swiveling domain-containing protein
MRTPTRLIYHFTDAEPPTPAQAGGKAFTLIVLARAGFPVPPGFVLTAGFFAPWLQAVKNSREWAAVLRSRPEELGARCDAAKAFCRGLGLDPERRQALSEALSRLSAPDRELVVAVRSSSPEEDLAAASFAGAYQTVLGVRAQDVEEAVRQVAASCLDEKICLYKREHGFNVAEPRIAVIVQVQVPAETAGVAFSLDPVDNCYDKAVISANYGLGESVVAGMASPDTFIVDKLSGEIRVRKTGRKETAVYLDPAGGTRAELPPAGRLPCLSDRQAGRVARMTVQAEEHFGRPVDIEWAFADGYVFLLQARPITAYFPVPAEMMTAPGEPRTLYIDYTLAKQGVPYPLSVMGAEIWERIQRAALPGLPEEAWQAGTGLMFTVGGRFYANLSYYLKLQGRERAASQMRIQDEVASQIIRNVDPAYTAPRLPRSLKGIIVRTVLSKVGTLSGALKAYWRPARYEQHLLKETESFLARLEAAAGRPGSPGALAEELVRLQDRYMSRVALPVTVAAELARSRIKRLFAGASQELRARLPYLERALPRNVTIDMGLALDRLASYTELAACSSAEEFTSRIETRTFSPQFLSTWDDFAGRYGHRGSRELDIAAPRFAEEPGQLFAQLRALALASGGADNARAVHERGRLEREQAFTLLMARAGSPAQAKRLAKLYEVLVTFGAYKEINKFYIIKLVAIVRERMLREAAALVAAGRLDHPAQIFDLRLADLDRGLGDPNVDLRALAWENTRAHRLFRHVREFPRVFDSRGRILRAPAARGADGTIVGVPISPGTVRGPVKVLNSPTEKPLLPGEILVARATDPGWTPLFVTAAGVLLEVGGVLQHGAVVAREYGKPCIVGIEDATSIFEDGEMIELDGTNGVVRRVRGDDIQKAEADSYRPPRDAEIAPMLAATQENCHD